MATITKEISDAGAISAYGMARSTVKGKPPSPDELNKTTRIGGPACRSRQARSHTAGMNRR